MKTRQLVPAIALGVGSMVAAAPSGPVAADTFTVTNNAAAGAGSLAAAVADANANAGPDTITFAPSVTGVIDIGATTLTPTDPLTITGPGSATLAVTNTAASPIFDVSDAFELTGLSLTESDGPGLVIAAGAGDVTVADVSIDNTSVGLIVGSAGALSLTDVSVANAVIGVQVTTADSFTGADISVDFAPVQGLFVSTVTNAVSLDRVDVGGSFGLPFGVVNSGGSVDVDDVDVTTSFGTMVVDTAASASLTNADLTGFNGTLQMTSLTGSATIENVDLGGGLNVGGVDSATLENVHAVLGAGGPPFATISGVTADVAIADSSVTAMTFGASFNVAGVGGSVSVTDTDVAGFTSAAFSGVGGDLDLVGVSVETNLGSTSIAGIGGALTLDDSELSSTTVSGVTGPTVIVDSALGTQTVFPSPGLSGADLDDVLVQRTTIAGGGTVFSSSKPNTTVVIEDSELTSTASLALIATTSPTTDVSISGSLLASPLGGLLIDGLSSAAVTNTTISGVTGVGSPPLSVIGTPTTIVNSTVSGNANAGFIALTTDDSVTIHNSIIAGNSGSEFDTSGAGLITAESSILTPDADTPIAGSNNLRIEDPQLGALADNGGRTRTMLPATGSPAIDAGDDALAGTPSVDQRGVARPAGAIDMGAVEVDNGVISLSDVTVDETDGVVQVTLTRSGIGDADAAVDVSTADGTATAGDDYTAVSTTVSWTSGDATPKTVDVPILTDTLLEGDETFTVTLANPTTTTPPSLVTVAAPTATVTIVDVPPGPAISSLAPERFVDTRPGQTTLDGRYAGVGKRSGDTELEVIIAGRGGVPDDARAAVMNITAIAAEGVGFVTAHPCVSPRPNASSLNVTAGVNLGNEVVAGLSADGSVCLYTSGAAHLTVDVVGFVGADSPTSPVTPARILDTRATGTTVDGLFEGGGTTGAGGQIALDVAGRGGVPTGAEAVIVNVTAVGPTENGFVTVHPCVTPIPQASSLNHVAGVNRGNELIVSLNVAGQTCLSTSSSIHLTADVVGYIPAGTNYAPVAPARLLDTRPGESTIDGDDAGVGRLDAGDEYELTIAGRGGVPADAAAAVVNLTAVGADGVGFITVHPCVDPRPNASSLNYVAGVNGGNEVVAQLDSAGKVCIDTSTGTHITVDVVGALL